MSVSVAGCFPAAPEKQKGPLVETPAWLCEAAQSTASSYGAFSRSVTTSVSFLCLATIGVLILAFSLCSSPASSHPSLKFPYACELKIVTALPWESFQFLFFCVVVSRSSRFLPLATSLCAPAYTYELTDLQLKVHHVIVSSLLCFLSNYLCPYCIAHDTVLSH